MTNLSSSPQSNHLDDPIVQAMPIELLQLEVHTYEALKHQGVYSIGDLVGYSSAELQDMPGVTAACLNDVTTALGKQLGLHLREN